MASTEGVRAHNCLAFIGPGPTLGLDHSHSCVDMVHMQTIVPSLPVERVGNYQVLEKLGAGGMGVVYKAVDLKLDRTVALKFLSQEGFEAPDREQLLREARAASALDHANIGTVYGVEDTDDGRLCIVMASMTARPWHRRCDAARCRASGPSTSPARSREGYITHICME